jgi:hypothetical protein
MVGDYHGTVVAANHTVRNAVDVIIDYLSFSESLCFGLFQLFVGKCLSQGLLKK